jgi:DNA topoisomerase-1
LGRDEDVLEIGANRAIDLIVAKESGAGGFRRGAADPGRALGEDASSGARVVVKAGRFGPYVTDGTTNATLPRALSPDLVSLDEALRLLAARREATGGKKPARGRKAPARSATVADKAAANTAPARKGAARPTSGKALAERAAPKKASSKKTASKAAAKKSAARRTDRR